jgi:hypothetical protein
MIFNVACDRRGRWNWSLMGDDRQLIAISPQTYPTDRECLEHINRVKGSWYAAVERSSDGPVAPRVGGGASHQPVVHAKG